MSTAVAIAVTDLEQTVLPSPAFSTDAWDDEKSPTRALRALSERTTRLLDAPRYNTPPCPLSAPLEESARHVLEAIILPPHVSGSESETVLIPALPVSPAPPPAWKPGPAWKEAEINRLLAESRQGPGPDATLDTTWHAAIKEHGMTMFPPDPATDHRAETRPLLGVTAFARQQARLLGLRREVEAHLTVVAAANAQIQVILGLPGEETPGGSVYGM